MRRGVAAVCGRWAGGRIAAGRDEGQNDSRQRPVHSIADHVVLHCGRPVNVVQSALVTFVTLVRRRLFVGQQRLPARLRVEAQYARLAGADQRHRVHRQRRELASVGRTRVDDLDLAGVRRGRGLLRRDFAKKALAARALGQLVLQRECLVDYLG
jgi:hypothetical protein